jgi:hypothetical protein
MDIVASLVVLPLIVAALGLGILQALVTPWGLLRQAWIVWKLGLTAVALAVFLLQLPAIAALALRASDGGALPAEARMAMVLHSAGGLAVLLAAAALSIYKPAGRAKVAASAAASRTN